MIVFVLGQHSVHMAAAAAVSTSISGDSRVSRALSSCSGQRQHLQLSSGIGLLGRKGNPGCNGRSGIAPYIITLVQSSPLARPDGERR